MIGADDALESICFRLFFSAYVLLYSIENSHCERGIPAAYQKLFNIHKNNIANNVP
ncbi:MAG: hypothetical protein Q8S84_09645 [bacterium]|nr:hypothetical protein [bacterium]MDP3381676.1 hypothetical protein [bacterium]